MSDTAINLGVASYPARPRTIEYCCHKNGSEGIHPIYRVVLPAGTESAAGGTFPCLPEAEGFPEMELTREQLDAHFVKLEQDNVPRDESSEEGRHPSLADLKNKKWQVGSDVSFKHYNVMTPGRVAGRFVCKGRTPGPTVAETSSLVLLLRAPLNKLLLSHEVTDLEIADGEAMVNPYIQGLNVLAIVAALIVSLTYPPMIDPPKGTKGILGVLPVLFMLLKAIAFYFSVVPLVVMIAFIPTFGTARQWEPIFLSVLHPFVVGFITFYMSFIISVWVTSDSWQISVAVTLLGCFAVVGVYFGAIHLETPWDWYLKRSGKQPCALRVWCRLQYLLSKTSNSHDMALFIRTFWMTRQSQQQAHLLGEFSNLRAPATST